MRSPSDQLLKTFAAVPVGSDVLIWDVSPEPYAEVLLQLGFAIDLRVPGASDAAERRLIASGMAADRWNVASQTEPLSDDAFDWVVWVLPDAPPSDGPAVLSRLRSALRPGGWCYACTAPDLRVTEESTGPYTPQLLETWGNGAQMAEAQAPTRVPDEDALHGIYRRVEADTPL